jgi:hypothetical protein
MATGRIPTTANSPLTAKGDLFTFSTGSAKLAVGSNGDTLVADSATATGLAYREDYAAGKNKIINADFRFNQRGFTSSTSSGTYGFDRWVGSNSDGTVTYTPQTFTLGAAPVAGYEAINFAQIVTTGQTLTTASALLQQRIESVRSFAGQTVTVSFWIKANSGTPNVNVILQQYFGTGGSPSTSVDTNGTVQAITTSWARYSFTITVPSISGKTLGTNSDNFLALQIFVSGGSASRAPTVGIQTNTFQIWGVQIEDGSVATAFQTATGTIQGELAACQRYFQVIGGTASGFPIVTGYASASSQSLRWPISFPVQMRTAPTATKNGTWATSNSGQPSAAYINAQGFSIEITSTSSGIIYVHPDGTDDTITLSSEL